MPTPIVATAAPRPRIRRKSTPARSPQRAPTPGSEKKRRPSTAGRTDGGHGGSLSTLPHKPMTFAPDPWARLRLGHVVQEPLSKRQPKKLTATPRRLPTLPFKFSTDPWRQYRFPAAGPPVGACGAPLPGRTRVLLSKAKPPTKQEQQRSSVRHNLVGADQSADLAAIRQKQAASTTRPALASSRGPMRFAKHPWAVYQRSEFGSPTNPANAA